MNMAVNNSVNVANSTTPSTAQVAGLCEPHTSGSNRGKACPRSPLRCADRPILLRPRGTRPQDARPAPHGDGQPCMLRRSDESAEGTGTEPADKSPERSLARLPDADWRSQRSWECVAGHRQTRAPTCHRTDRLSPAAGLAAQANRGWPSRPSTGCATTPRTGPRFANQSATATNTASVHPAQGKTPALGKRGFPRRPWADQDQVLYAFDRPPVDRSTTSHPTGCLGVDFLHRRSPWRCTKRRVPLHGPVSWAFEAIECSDPRRPKSAAASPISVHAAQLRARLFTVGPTRCPVV
jgi:hypothetical protein